MRKINNLFSRHVFFFIFPVLLIILRLLGADPHWYVVYTYLIVSVCHRLPTVCASTVFFRRVNGFAPRDFCFDCECLTLITSCRKKKRKKKRALTLECFFPLKHKARSTRACHGCLSASLTTVLELCKKSIQEI